MTVDENIRSVRKRDRWSQEKFAGKADLSGMFISRIYTKK
jgi:transcriptional regulator with XRE-family HTH domain